MKARPEYVWEKFCDVPPHIVWRMWTDPSLFSKWYGPNVETVIHEMRVEKRGAAHLEMKWADQSQYQKFEYLDVQPQQKLVWLQSFTDSEWNTLPIENWPKVLLATVEFHKEAGRDCMHFTWSPYGEDVSDAQIDNFKKARLDMDAAWKSALELFDGVLHFNGLAV